MRSTSPLRILSTAFVVLAGSFLSATGCADNSSSLFIAGVLYREPGSRCEFTPQGDATLLTDGVMDTSITKNYRMPLLIGNQLIARGDEDKLRTETARIVIRGAVVDVIDTASNTSLDNFTTNATGFAHPASGSNPGWGVTIVNVIPADLDLGLDLLETRELNIAVSVFGDTLGGEEVESSTLTFPVFACNGCLVDCSTSNPLNGSCDVFPDEGITLDCYYGQDFATPCQVSEVGNTICSFNQP